jgi:hypothetical protein
LNTRTRAVSAGAVTAGLMRFAVCAGLMTIATAMSAKAAEPPDLSGIWLATSPRSIITADLPELTPRARADIESFDPLDDPVIRCVMPGFPRSGMVIYPFEIVQTEDMLVFLYEHFGMVRRIYMDGRSPPDYLPPARMGFSVGHWEGEELVVETTHIAAGLLSGAGLRQYGDVSVVERYRLVDNGRRLETDITITAPQTFLTPWARRMTWEHDPDGLIFEAVCDPADSRF